MYKCYYPLTRNFLEFGDVEISYREGDDAFVGRLVRSDRPAALGVRAFEGRIRVTASHIFTAVALEATD